MLKEYAKGSQFEAIVPMLSAKICKAKIADLDNAVNTVSALIEKYKSARFSNAQKMIDDDMINEK